MNYQVWVKWLGSDLQVEQSFETNREADCFLKELENDNKDNRNFIEGFVATRKDFDLMERLFPEDF